MESVKKKCDGFQIKLINSDRTLLFCSDIPHQSKESLRILAARDFGVPYENIFT